jgi:segregation and condensation protein B
MKKLIEAALFMASKPLRIEELSKITGVHSLGTLKNEIEALKKDYEKSAMEIVETSEGYWMQVRNEFLPKVASLTPYSDLSEGHKRTLALIVLKEPINQSEIIKIQGNKAYTYIKFLDAKGLIKKEKSGRTKILRLTQEFERYFGEEKSKIREKLIQSLGESSRKPI